MPRAPARRRESPLVHVAVREVLPLLAQGLVSSRQPIGDTSAATKLLLRLLFVLLARARGRLTDAGSLDRPDELFASLRGPHSPLIKACTAVPAALSAVAVKLLTPYVSRSTSVGELGTVYETVLGQSKQRKSSGSFYTPDYLVRYIVRHTLDPLLRDRRAIRVIDPAVGGGHFLVAAAEHISAALQRTGPRVRRQHIIERCLFGVDLDPVAAEVTRLSLWLEAPGVSFDALDAHLHHGDGLKTFDAESFDATLCNPPYAGHRRDRASCGNHPNLAAAFCERCVTLLRPHGRYGLIVPKSVQYVEAWSDTRTLLSRRNRLDRLLDANESFDDVLLEQTICIGRRGAPAAGYRAGEVRRGRIRGAARIPCGVAIELDCLPAAIEPLSLPLLRRISRRGPRLGDIATTGQALGYQAHVTNGNTDRRRAMNIFRGRHLRPLAISTSSDWIAHEHLLNRAGDGFTPKIEAMLRPKVVSQNIIAHVTRPRPRLWIISAPDPTGVLCLNTVSTTVIHDPRFPIEYVAVVLNSSLASWFYSEFAFCRAVRTMHFDGYYAGKLPIALPRERDVAACRDLCAQASTMSCRTMRQAAIDRIVFDAYRLHAVDRQFIRHFCYGEDAVNTAASAAPPPPSTGRTPILQR